MALVTRDHCDPYMPVGFNRRKSIQAVAVLLKTRPNETDNYTRLLKVLYIADRESIQETGFPITGDRFVAMPHGTMLSRLYDLAIHKVTSKIIYSDDHSEWAKYIASEGKYDIRLASDPGDGALSEYDIEKLHEVADKHKNDTWRDMRRITHGLPEWNDPGKSSRLISLRDYLSAVQMEPVAKKIDENQRESGAFSRLLER